VNHAAGAKHGEAAVLDLSELVPLHGLGVLAEAEGVELEVAGGALAVEGLEEGVGAEHLGETEPGEELPHASLGDDLVVEASHLGTAGDLGEGGVGGDVLEHGAGGGEHGDAAVLELSLAEELDVGDRGEAEGVEANVTNHGAIEGLGLLEEGDRGGHLHAHGGLGDGAAGHGGGGEGRGRGKEGSDSGEAEHVGTLV